MSAAVATADGAVDRVDVRDRADVRRQVKLVSVFAIVAALLVFFVVDIKDPDVLGTLGVRVTKDDPSHQFNGELVVWAALVIALVGLVLAAVNRLPKGWISALVAGLVGVGFFASFIIWNYADQAGTLVIVYPLPGTVRLATPLVFGDLDGCLC